MMKKRRYSGFTLIEIMLVIAIIAVLLSICIPSYMRARKQARLQACCSNLVTVATAINMMESEAGGGYCRAIQKNETGTISKTELGKALISQGYLKAYPECPESHTQYSLEAVAPTTVVNPQKAGIAQAGSWKIWCTDKTHGHGKAPHYYSWCGLIVK